MIHSERELNYIHVHMANVTVSVIVLAILISQFTTAVENKTRISPKYVTSLHLNGDVSASSLHSQLLCSSHYNNILNCQQDEPLLPAGYCATYSNHTKLVSILRCPYFQPNGYNYTSKGKIILPKIVSELNDYMCDPLNRKSLVCSECADGFGPSVTLIRFRCIKCTNAWYYGVPLFLVLKFAPVTIVYLVILVFQIRVTSAPIPCLIISAQLVKIAFGSITIPTKDEELILTNHEDIRLDMKVVLSLLNLDFHQYFVTPYCISSRLKFIHIAFISYISAFYPILLIFLTWLCIELHGRNFRLLVYLWRPFHRCFVRLRRGWDAKSDIIDAFITFFFLTYSTILYQTLLLISSTPIKNIEPSGKHFLTYVSVLDHSIGIGSKHHLLFAIPVILVSLVFNLLPFLLLILYPIRVFRSCLLKYHLNFIVMHTFMDKVYGCYRNGLDGGRDMRSFSGLYIFLGVAAYITVVLTHTVKVHITFINEWFATGTLFFVVTLTITIAKPYQKAYMNYLDTLLLSYNTILCYVLSSGFRTFLVARILITAPFTVTAAVVISRKLYEVSSKVCTHKLKSSPFKFINNFRAKKLHDVVGSTRSPTANTPTTESAQPLIQPTSTVICYGIKNS